MSGSRAAGPRRRRAGPEPKGTAEPTRPARPTGPAGQLAPPGPDAASAQLRTAFVLSGGGNLGALQVGMLRALLERHVRADLVVGTSVGAINGAGFAADPTRRGVRHLETMWARVPEFAVMPATWVPNPVQLARKGTSIHGNDGLRRLIDFGLSVRDFSELTLPFQCVATDIDTAEEVWFDTGELADALLASAALPAVFPPVRRDGRRFLDGGIVDDIPLTRAAELGARRIYVLHVGWPGTAPPEPRRPLDVALWTYWLARRARYQRDRAALAEGIELIELAPAQRPGLRFDDFTRSAELFRAGHAAALAVLDAPLSTEPTTPSTEPTTPSPSQRRSRAASGRRAP